MNDSCQLQPVYPLGLQLQDGGLLVSDEAVGVLLMVVVAANDAQKVAA